MSMFYFRRRAARSYRDARSSHAPPLEYENFMKLGSEFAARATRGAGALGWIARCGAFEGGNRTAGLVLGQSGVRAACPYTAFR
jgi:hypothetical protein